MAAKTPAQIRADNPAAALDGTEAVHMTQGSPPASVGASSQQIKDYAEKLVLRTETANYQLALSDAGKVVEMNLAGANTLTVPPNGTVAFPIGTQIMGVQLGAGQTQIVAGSGVTIRTAATLFARAQYSAFSLYKRGTNEWVLAGDLQAPSP